MLHDLANGDGFVALKRAAEDRKGCQKAAVHQKTTDDNSDKQCRNEWEALDVYEMMMMMMMMMMMFDGDLLGVVHRHQIGTSELIKRYYTSS